MAVDYSRDDRAKYVGLLRDEGQLSTMQQAKPHPTDAKQSPPVDKSADERPPPGSDSSAKKTAAARSRSPNRAPAAGTSSNVAPDDDEGDVEAESAYQRTMWARIQRSQREIQLMRTPMIDGFVPARGFHELHRTNPMDGPGKSGPLSNATVSHHLGHHAPEPANYVDLNRRHVHHRGSNIGRRVALYPSKTYAEMFAKKKENETGYMNIGTKNGKFVYWPMICRVCSILRMHYVSYLIHLQQNHYAALMRMKANKLIG